MGITDKTRKLLWGKSGNRCARCRHVLSIDATVKDDESIIGDECHIISGKENGPRYDQSYPKINIDSYENLILLCRIHHKLIDDQHATYTAEYLQRIKRKHEKWVSEQLNKSLIINPDISVKPVNRQKRIKEREKELFRNISSEGIKWAKQTDNPLIVKALSRSVPKYEGFWWKEIWKTLVKISKSMRKQFLKSLLKSIKNSTYIIELCQMMFEIDWKASGIKSSEAEELAIKHMWRLQNWGGEVKPIRWLIDEEDKFQGGLDGTISTQALNTSHKVAKLADLEVEWYMMRIAILELTWAISGSKSYDFADEACWIVVQDLMEEPDPFEPLVKLYSLGLTPLGYGLKYPYNRYFYIAVNSYLENKR